MQIERSLSEILNIIFDITHISCVLMEVHSCVSCSKKALSKKQFLRSSVQAAIASSDSPQTEDDPNFAFPPPFFLPKLSLDI